jgi:hypothetical protein
MKSQNIHLPGSSQSWQREYAWKFVVSASTSQYFNMPHFNSLKPVCVLTLQQHPHTHTKMMQISKADALDRQQFSIFANNTNVSQCNT